MNSSSEENQAKYLLDVLWKDKNRPYRSRVEECSLDIALDDEGDYGENVEECNPESNLLLPALVFHGSPTPKSIPNNGTPSFAADTPRPKTPTTTSNLSPAPFLRDQSGPNSRRNHINNAVDNTGLLHNQDCNADFKLEKTLRRHIETANAHRLSAFQCCCELSFGRKDNFRSHLERKKPCDPIAPFLCSCGYQVESSNQDSVGLILKHIKACGRKRGRPKNQLPLVPLVAKLSEYVCRLQGAAVGGKRLSQCSSSSAIIGFDCSL
ncbi:hypothetical protein M441DRAFT_46744 [Trichoderma asperellum CBS 433.97]|uniref:Uncharacterized protein n=1 Tax=Trichoderma asperellum (strain ATCC 204424 / CBS 433.97 / NBRC 101777) TaxID=1042311 RepID=A0A2T3Z9W8_TRIA4|nr:hypothetical protein M441DRAFT_46744 [Trichoderma asperellum CBS 433.97]PTB41609.1 hypothetical protein M441DRAFT_46744 [Trichoderma asperellum CBS 433.97]